MKHEKNQESFALAELTYCDRQLIVITDDAVAHSARETGRKLALEAQGVNWTRLAQAAVTEIVPLGGLVAEVSREAFKA